MATLPQAKAPIPFGSKPLAPIPFGSPPIAAPVTANLPAPKPAAASTPTLGDLSANQYQQSGQKIVSSVTEGAKKIAEGTQKGGLGGAGQAGEGVLQAGLGTAAGAVQGIFAPMTAILQKALSTAPGKVAVKALNFGNPGLDAQGNPKLDAAGAQVQSPAEKAISDWAKVHPDAARNLMDAFTVGTAAIGGNEAILGKEASGLTVKGGALGVKAAATDAASSANDFYTAIITKDPAKVDQFISQQYQKGVRPTSVGNNTEGQLASNQARQLGAVKSIVANKANLHLVDQYGEPTGTVPQTLSQFSQAVDQTKATVFAKYNALQKQAGAQGAKVDLVPAATELQTVANDRVLNDLHPEVATYAKSKADMLTARGTYTTEEAQNAIKTLNTSLEAFYKNPSYDNASRASVDSLVVSKLREGLDATIESTTGPGYQELKNEYGALRSIEKDVIHRAIVDGRKNNVGVLASIGDYASGAELVRGLITMNPADLAVSGTIKGIGLFQKYINNPNTAIKRLFEAADAQATKANAGSLPSRALSTQPVEQQK